MGKRTRNRGLAMERSRERTKGNDNGGGLRIGLGKSLGQGLGRGPGKGIGKYDGEGMGKGLGKQRWGGTRGRTKFGKSHQVPLLESLACLNCLPCEKD